MWGSKIEMILVTDRPEASYSNKGFPVIPDPEGTHRVDLGIGKAVWVFIS